MPSSDKSQEYYRGCHVALLEAVPARAQRILDVGCAEGRLGAALKERVSGRRVWGVELRRSVAERAATRLDGVFRIDVETEDPDLEPGSLDCITYGDVLEHLRDPEAVLARHRRLLAPGGVVVCSVPNVQHHSIVQALARGDFQYQSEGLLDETHLRFFTYSTFTKLLLDAGYLPDIVTTEGGGPPTALRRALRPLLRRCGVASEPGLRRIGAFHYIFRGEPRPWPGSSHSGGDDGAPLIFVVPVDDEDRLRANLWASPCLRPGTRHELVQVPSCAGLAVVVNEVLDRGGQSAVVCVRPDVYLPRGWCRQLGDQLDLCRAAGPVGVVGIRGVVGAGGEAQPVGGFVLEDRYVGSAEGLPAQVDTLDDTLLVLPGQSPLRLDPQLGAHWHGTDLAMRARAEAVGAWAIGALCYHNRIAPDPAAPWMRSTGLLMRKWGWKLPPALRRSIMSETWKRSRGGVGRVLG